VERPDPAARHVDDLDDGARLLRQSQPNGGGGAEGVRSDALEGEGGHTGDGRNVGRVVDQQAPVALVAVEVHCSHEDVLPVRLRAECELRNHGFSQCSTDRADLAVGIGSSINDEGRAITVDAGPGPPSLAAATLGLPYPNPTARRSRLDLVDRRAGPVHVAVYDVTGRLVETLYDGVLGAGERRALEVRGAGLASGRCFVRVRDEMGVRSREVIIVR